MEANHHPDEDIQQALQASRHEEQTKHQAESQGHNLPSDTLTENHPASLRDTCRLAMVRCGLMAVKYPWQTVAALGVSIGCGFVCEYFGLAAIAALILYAATCDDLV